MADSYVCSGATMKCTMGTKTAKLTVLPIRTVFLTGQPMANISDHLTMINLAPFGRCRSLGFPATATATAAHHGHLTPMPCMHNTPFPWMGGKMDYIVKGDPALLKSCTCQCMWGGTISLITDGQTPTGSADTTKKSKDSYSQSKSNNDQEDSTLDANSVLDGIQLALDAAGFAPGLGAVPDLLNAAISALRGNWADAGLSVVAAVPIIGDVAAGVKIAKKGKNIAKMAKRCISKNVDVSIKGLVKHGMSVDDAKAFRRAVRNERRNYARKFYENNNPNNMTRERIDTHLSGIDFTKPVTIKKLPPPGQNNVTVYQYNSPSKVGNYYTLDPKAKPTDLGIADVYGPSLEPKVKYTGILSDETTCLESTAKGVYDTWSVPGHSIKTNGGATQYYIPKNNAVPNMTIIK